MHNILHEPNGQSAETVSTAVELSPRQNRTLVVIQEDRPIRLCMYGADDASRWPGNVCDSDDVARSCPMFKARLSVGEAKDEFAHLIEDDEYVFNNYRDVATLQWVLGERIHERELSLWERLVVWIHMKLARTPSAAKALPVPTDVDLWSEDDTAPPAGS